MSLLCSFTYGLRKLALTSLAHVHVRPAPASRPAPAPAPDMHVEVGTQAFRLQCHLYVNADSFPKILLGQLFRLTWLLRHEVTCAGSALNIQLWRKLVTINTSVQSKPGHLGYVACGRSPQPTKYLAYFVPDPGLGRGGTQVNETWSLPSRKYF